MFSLLRTDSPGPFPDTVATLPQTLDNMQLGEYIRPRPVHESGIEHIPKEHTTSSAMDSSHPADPSASPSSIATAVGKTRLSSPSISCLIANVRLSPPCPPHSVASSAADSNRMTFVLPLSINRPANGPSQNSSTKNAFRTAWHGVEQLLRMVERSLAGTPFQGSVGALNAIIDVINVRSIISLYLAIFHNHFVRRLETTRTHSKNMLFRLPNV